MHYDNSGIQIPKSILLNALNRLGDLLQEKDRPLELVCCGGVVSVLYHGSREMTHDVDVLFPNNAEAVALLLDLIDQVGAEFDLEHGARDKWLNDSVSFIGLVTKSETVVFHHPFLVLKAADWHEMLAHKLTAFRGQRDIDDAVQFLKAIGSNDKTCVFATIGKYRPLVPQVSDLLFEHRFNQIWEDVHGK